jgi:hypothetical protein
VNARDARRIAREDVAGHAQVLADSIPADADPDDLKMREAYLWVANFLDPYGRPPATRPNDTP